MLAVNNNDPVFAAAMEQLQNHQREKVAKLFTVDPKRPQMLDLSQLNVSINYLYWFGYLAYEILKHVSVEDVVNAVKAFQRWFGVRGETGKLGPKTRWAMNYPRCGCPDFHDPSNDKHKKFMRLADAAVTQPRWQKRELKYYIADYIDTDTVSKSAQDAIIAQAWSHWTDIARLGIASTRTAAEADLIIDTGRGPADDMDGPGGVLAWSYMPEGEDKQLLMRFDLDESWTVDPKDNGVCLLNVACHEFGHMLGLSHSRKSQALMAPFYNESVATPQEDDDHARIQRLYGEPKLRAVRSNSIPTVFQLSCMDLQVLGYKLVPDRKSALKKPKR